MRSGEALMPLRSQPCRCTCEWPSICDGSGTVSCRARPHGCFCQCGHHDDCYGCANCEGRDEDGAADFDDANREDGL